MVYNEDSVEISTFRQKSKITITNTIKKSEWKIRKSLGGKAFMTNLLTLYNMQVTEMN